MIPDKVIVEDVVYVREIVQPTIVGSPTHYKVGQRVSLSGKIGRIEGCLPGGVHGWRGTLLVIFPSEITMWAFGTDAEYRVLPESSLKIVTD